MTKYSRYGLLIFILLLLQAILIIFSPHLVWLNVGLLCIWGLSLFRIRRLYLKKMEYLDSIKSELNEVLVLFGRPRGTVYENIADIATQLKQQFEQFEHEKAVLEARLGDLQKKADELDRFNQSLDSLCPVHLPIDIESRWAALIEREWGQVNKEALGNLNAIKLMNDQNLEFISEVIGEFGEQQENFSTFSQKYRINMEEYSRRAEGAKKAVLNELAQSSLKIEKTFAQFSQIEDITEKIKMISLNLNIEASKVRGSEAFSFLARELRRLALSTEDSIKTISLSIKDTVGEMKRSQEEQVRDLSTMDAILLEFEQILKEYDNASENLRTYMRRAMDRINSNQEEQKAILLNFFKTLQQVAITKEELEHQVAYYGIFMRQTNEYVQKILRSEKKCLGPSCPQRRAALQELSRIANTDEERRMVNDLFKELLGEDREAEHGTLVGDANDFISF